VELQGESHSVCMHLEVDAEKAWLEVELMTPKRYDYGGLGCYALVVIKGILQEDGRHSWV